MFYAPDLTNVEIGTSRPALRDQPWLPFVGYEGPHGFLIIVVDAEVPLGIDVVEFPRDQSIALFFDILV